MNRKKIKLMIASITVSQIISLSSIAYASTNIYNLSDINYDYSNPIYSNGVEDTYIYDSTDSVITTKTGVQRNLPEVTGRYDKSYYPIPEVNKVPNESTFELIKQENKELMDNVENDIANGTLKKHIAADGQFYGTVPDDALGVEKKVYINTNSKGLHSLAVYVPAGEIATVKLNDEALSYAKKGKVKVAVGMTMIDATSYGSNSNNENRMPYLGKVFNVSEQEIKVGTPFGGMVYIDIDSSVPSGLKFEVDVKGVVDAPYFDLGKTTNEEWEIAKKAPGVFAEIRTPYLRFVVPSKFIRETKNIEEALKFWTNTVSLSATIMNKLDRTTPMTLTFDQYITVGIAYATVGWWTCNLPPSWATNALDFNSLVSDGSWGLIHEINHHYQSRHSGYDDNWGLGPEFSEITNNALSTLSYILYTNIAEYRDENGTYDWNKVADPYSSLKQQIYEGKAYYNGIPNIGNFMFSAFAHEIGPVNFANVVKSTYDGGTINGIYLEPYDYQGENSGKLTRNDRYDDMAYRFCVAGGRDYTWYIKNELRWPLKEETVQKIKNLGYEEFIPVQTVYGVGEVGRETGRAFYVPSSGYTFDFEKSLVSPGDVTVVDVSKPKYGTLTKRSDGKYDYETNPSMPENEKDQFILTVNVKKDGINQITKLNCIIGVNYNSSKVEHFNITKWDIKEALEDLETKVPYEVSSSNGMRIDTHYGNKLARAKGYFKVDESGEYEFQVFGDDNAAFRVHLEDGQTLESITEDYSSNARDAYANPKSTHFKLKLEAGKVYSYTLIVNNKDGIGWGDVNIKKGTEGSNWQSITKVFSREEDINKTTNRSFTLPKAEFTRPSILAGGNETVIKGIKVLSHPIGVIPNSDPASIKEGDPNNIVDGDINTYFHSSYTNGNRTPFPHEYVFDLGDKKSFNNIEAFTRRTGDEVGVIGDYEIYVANEYNGDDTNWTKIAEDNTRHGNKKASKDLKISLPQTTARYIKLKALNNRDNYDLTILSEFKVSTETTVKNIIAQNSSFIQYEGNWTKESNGAFINGATYNTNDGYFMYAFEGTETNIYSATDVEVEIRIDDGKWSRQKLKGSLREPSITLKMPSQGKHIVEVRAVGQELALNMISTDGTFFKGEAPTSNPPVIVGADNIEIGVGQVDAFDKMKGVSCVDDKDGDELHISVSGEIGKPEPGNNESYTLIYTVTDSDRNTTTVERIVTVTNQLPEITGVEDIVIKAGEEINLKDGIKAIDKEDGNITDNIKVIGNVDLANPGIYDIEYEITDSDGNVTKVTRKITVEKNDITEILPPSINEAIDDKSLNLISGKGTSDEPAELEFNDIADEKVDKILDELKKLNIKIEGLESEEEYTILRFSILEDKTNEVKNQIILKSRNSYKNIINKLNKFAGKEEIVPPVEDEKPSNPELPPSGGDDTPSNPSEPPKDDNDKDESSKPGIPPTEDDKEEVKPELPPSGGDDAPSNPSEPPKDDNDKDESSKPGIPPAEDEKPSNPELPPSGGDDTPSNPSKPPKDDNDKDESSKPDLPPAEDENPSDDIAEILPPSINEAIDDKSLNLISGKGTSDEPVELEFNDIADEKVDKILDELKKLNIKIEGLESEEEYTILRFSILEDETSEVKNQIILKSRNSYKNIINKLNKFAENEEVLPPVEDEKPSSPELPPSGGDDAPSNPSEPPKDDNDKEEPSEPDLPPVEDEKPSEPELPPTDEDEKPSEPELPPTGGDDTPSNPSEPPKDDNDKDESSKPGIPPTEDDKEEVKPELPPSGGDDNPSNPSEPPKDDNASNLYQNNSISDVKKETINTNSNSIINNNTDNNEDINKDDENQKQEYTNDESIKIDIDEEEMLILQEEKEDNRRIFIATLIGASVAWLISLFRRKK